ncbi:hypothetical protein LIER_14200 [Lithospermum erythrorhizon]|uniref:Uncharacterized protein n=1 Tax=Lithospermum erythrorhizon TaxID=34254 RepID=A0AAV3PYD6_LITER
MVSPIHLKMKFPTRHGIGEMQESQERARGCYLASMKRIKAQMEVGATSSGTMGPADWDIVALEGPDESPRKPCSSESSGSIRISSLGS